MLDPPSQAALIATGVRGSLAGGGVEGSAQQAESPWAEGEGFTCGAVSGEAAVVVRLL